MARTRLLYYSPAGVTLYQWRAGVLSEEARFELSDMGLARFADRCVGLRSSVVHVLVDVVEEAFNIDTIPFVRGNDRRTLLQRRLAQRYRDAALTTAISLGYERSVRREERVLLTAFTNAAEIHPWLQALEREEVPVSGVYSPAVLANQLARKLKFAKPSMLLVGFHAGGVRQTYLRRGRAEFSRLNPLAAEDIGDGAAITAALERETDRLFRYLRTMHPHLEREQTDAIVITPPGQTERMHGFSTDTSVQLRVQLIDQHTAAKRIGLKQAPPNAGIEALFLHMLALRRPSHQYATRAIRASYGIRAWQIGLTAGGVAICAACLFAAGVQFLQTRQLQQEIDADHERIALANARHDAITGTFPPLPTSLENLRAVLDQYNAIERANREPGEMMVAISRALDRTPYVVLDRFDWKVENDADGRREIVELTATLPDVARTDLRLIDQLSQNLAHILREQPGLEVSGVQLPFDLDSLKTIQGSDRSAEADRTPRIRLTVTRKIDA